MANERLLTDKTGQDIVKALEAIAITGGGSAQALDAVCEAMINGTNTSRVFNAWLPRAIVIEGPDADRYALLCRFADFVSNAWKDKTYTLRNYKAEVSSETAITPLDDLANMAAGQLCTESTKPVEDWVDEDPIGGWYVRANALSLADGNMNITAFEGEEGFDTTGEEAPVYTFTIALWIKEWEDESYEYISYRTTQAEGFYPDAGDVGLDGTKRAVTWHPTFPGALNSKGALTSGAGRKAYNFASAEAGITAARKMDAYEGLWNDCDTRWLLRMWQLRHFNLENSGIAEGCTNYNLQYQLALAETGVKRVLLSTTNGANFVAGSTVSIGTRSAGNSDRGQASMRDIADLIKISSIETVNVNGNNYTALNLELTENINTATTYYVSTMPWHSGSTEVLPGHKDGCVHSLTAGKGPLRVAGVEVLDGAYAIGLDPLYNCTTGSGSGKFNYAVHECRDSEKLAGSITSNYKATGITYTDMPQGWQYVKAFVKCRLGVLFPRLIGGSSTAYYKSAFFGSGSAGVRCPWRFASLGSAGAAGLACEAGNSTPSYAGWYGRPRLCGSGKKRGEWTE